MRPLVTAVTGLAAIAAGIALSAVPTPVVASTGTVRTPLPTLQPLPTLDLAPTQPLASPSVAATVRPDAPCRSAERGTVATRDLVTYVCAPAGARVRWRVVAA